MNILKNSYSVGLIIAFMSVFSPISAQSEEIPVRGPITFKEFNEARSKRISERVQQGYQMRNLDNAPSFADIDANGDGGISAEEFTAHQSQRRQQRAQ